MRCVIVDDSSCFVDAARSLLETDGVTVVGVATNSIEALRCAETLRPDVTLVDINLGTESGFDLAEQLHRSAEAAPSPVILISTQDEADLTDLISASPAIGFLAKLALTPAAVRDLVDRPRR